MNLRKWALSLLLAAATGAAQAGDLKELYEQALASDPQLRAAAASRDAGLEAEIQGRAGMLPQVVLNGSLGRTESDPESLFDGNMAQLSVSLSQPLYRVANRIGQDIGTLQAERARIDYGRADQALIRRVVEAYLDVLQAETAFSSARAEEEAVKRRLDQIQAQFEVGVIAVTDLEEARAAYDGARVARIIAEGNLANSYEALERLTGKRWTAVQPLAEALPIDPLSPAEVQPWIDKALEGNLGLQLAALDVALAGKNSDIARAGRHPTVDLVASYTFDDGTYSPTDSVNRAFVGVNLQMPLYLGGSIDSRMRQAISQKAAAEALAEDARRAVVQQVRSLKRDLDTDLQTIAARRQTIVSTQTALDATEAGYSVGTRNIVDVLQAERARYAAGRDYQIARYTYLRHLFRFKEVLGTLSLDDLEALDRWLENRS